VTATIQQVALVCWATLRDMAPFLLFGFAVAGVVSLFITARAVRRHLGGHGLVPVVKAALAGVPLPLCSCGVIPVAASLRRQGASRGATTAFLISTPQTGVDSILVTFSLLGPVFAVFRPFAAFLSGVFGGFLVEAAVPGEAPLPGHLRHEDASNGPTEGGGLKGALRLAFEELPADIWRPLVAGVLIAGVISAILPDDFFAPVLGSGILAMVVMMALGIPVYVCATASVPIAAALIAKGVSPGAALVFLMSGPATNAATIATVWKTMGRRTALLYLASVAVSALAAGLVLDHVLRTSAAPLRGGIGWMLPDEVKTLSAVLLLALLVRAFLGARPKLTRRSQKAAGGARVLRIEGMTCQHCAQAVRNALLACPNVTSVTVDLKGGRAQVAGDALDPNRLAEAVRKAGYEVHATDGDEPGR